MAEVFLKSLAWHSAGWLMGFKELDVRQKSGREQNKRP